MASRKALIPMAVFFLAAAVYIPAGRAQDSQTSQSSVAEASRKAKAQQKSEPKSGKVFTDDDIASLKGNISVVGPEETPSPAVPTASTPAAQNKTAKQPVKDEAYWRKRFADARRALADDSKELDVLQREFNLKQVQFYSNPNVALREQHSRKDLDDTQAEINTKKQDVDKDNQAISDLQEDLRTSGGEPGWANEEPQPASQAESDSVPVSEPDEPAVTSHEAPQIQDQAEQSETPSPAQQQ
jgi:chromosome segregation ATPase